VKAPVERRSLTQQTYEWIKQSIFTGRLRPGERLDIDELARSLGVSRTPVRDAIQRLAFEGLALVTARRGTAVSSLTLEDVAHEYEARKLIEPAIAEAAARCASEQTLEELGEIQTEWERIDPDAVYRRFAVHSRYAELDIRFHAKIAEMLRNPRLDHVVRQLAIQRHVAPYVFGSAYIGARHRIGEHRTILAALERRDGAAARQAMQEHIERSGRELIEFLEAGPLKRQAVAPPRAPKQVTRRGARARRSA